MYPRNVMLTFLAAGLLSIGRAGDLLADDIEIGDTRDDVIKALGEPDGSVALGDTEVMFYSRGQIDIKDGKVAHHDVISQEEFEARQQSRLKAQREQSRRAAEQLAQTKVQKSAQPKPASTEQQLADMSGEEQVAYWRDYQRKNPGADVSAQLRKARARAGEEAEKKAEIEQKIAEGMKNPPIKMSRSKLRKYRRGRSKAALEARNEQLRLEFEADPK